MDHDNLSDTALLARTIETVVLPRLIASHGAEDRRALGRPFAGGRPVGRDVVLRLVDLTTDNDVDVVARFLHEQLAAGVSMEGLFLHLLAPAARELGNRGDAGQITFAEVDRCLDMLKTIVRMFDNDAPPQMSRGWAPGAALLAAMPGDRHTFGLFMVEELFKRDGWSVTTLPQPQRAELLRIVGQSTYSFIGLSSTTGVDEDALGELIADIRSESLNPEIVVLVGGAGMLRRADGSPPGGADALATDGTSAVQQIRRLTTHG
jgi:MerR family transcriptional regulator, light-induced transcriptional regulator